MDSVGLGDGEKGGNSDGGSGEATKGCGWSSPIGKDDDSRN